MLYEYSQGVNYPWQMTYNDIFPIGSISQLYLHYINCYTLIWEMKIVFPNVLLLCLHVKNFNNVILYHLWIS